MKKKILVLSMVVVLLAVLVMPMAVMAADNEGEQQASTSPATAINIVDKVGAVAVTTITFPEGAPGATVSAPYNDINTSADPQVLGAADSEPVVRLNNTSAGALFVTLEITGWTDGVVASERYELVTGGTSNVSVVDDMLSADGLAASISTGISIAAAATDDLYLEVTLSGLAGVSGTSTLTILGES